MTDTPPTEAAQGERKHQTNGQAHGRASLEKRRELVSRLVLRGMTYREVIEALRGQGFSASLATIHSDMKAIKATWRAATAENYDDIVARYVAEVGEARRMAIANNDVTNWLKALALQAKALGLDAPTKIEVRDWRTIAKENGMSDADIAAIEREAERLSGDSLDPSAN